jgi:hypothetical protein
MKWRFGSVKEKTRRFGEEAFGRNEGSSKKKNIRKVVLGEEEEKRFLGA